MVQRPGVSAQSNTSPASILKNGIKQLNLEITTPTQQQLLAYIALLEKWNKSFSLTAIHDPEQMVIRHLLDSLSLVPYIRGPRMVDVGCGAGLPGIPLALVFPEFEVELLDSQTKKVRFVRQIIADLKIANAVVAHTRVQDYHPQQMFDTVISRAFATLVEFTGATRHLCRSGGSMLAMKGRFPAKELDEIRLTGRVANVIPAHIPGLEAQRHIVQMSC